MSKAARVLLLLLFLILIYQSFYISNSYTSETFREDEQMIRVGVGAYQDGFHDIAERQLSLFLQSFPNHVKVYDVLYLLGRIHFQKERWKEARAAFLRIVQENKNFGTMDYTLFWMAQTEIKLGDFEAGRRWLLTLQSNYPGFEWIDYAYYLSGCIDFESRRLGAAGIRLKRSLSFQKEAT